MVEDDIGLQKQMRWSFDRFNLMFAGDRETAMAALRRHEPAVVTLDLGLPPDPDGTSEGFATLQQVRAWETEFRSVHDEALWGLYNLLWRLSVEGRADQPPEMRHALIEQLLAPARSAEMDGMARMAYLIRLFQITLLLRLHPLLAVQRETTVSEGEGA